MNKYEVIPFTKGKLEEHIEQIPDELMEKDYDELEAEAKPTKKDRLIKASMQREILRAMSEQRNVKPANICRGVCDIKHFTRNIITKPAKLAWMITPTPEQALILTVQNEAADNRLNELLEIDLYNEKGQLDTKRAQLLLQVIKVIKDRTDPIVNRQEIKQLTLTHDTSKSKLGGDIEEKIKRLEEELGKHK